MPAQKKPESKSKSSQYKSKSSQSKPKSSQSKSKSSEKMSQSSKPKQTTKSKTTIVEKSAPAPAVNPDPVVTPPVAVETHNEDSTILQIEVDFAKLTSKLIELKTLQSSIMSELKILQKNIHKHVKDTKKKKKKVVDPNKPKRSPSGFAKPALISNALCNFLGKENGTEMARTEVTKHLTEYIKTNELQDKENRRKIIPDKKLQSLLNVPNNEVLTYFNLQTFMKVHFPKSSSVSKTI